MYTNIRRFKEDLGRYPPHYFVCVPLVLDTLYKRVQVGSSRFSSLALAPGAEMCRPSPALPLLGSSLGMDLFLSLLPCSSRLPAASWALKSVRA